MNTTPPPAPAPPAASGSEHPPWTVDRQALADLFAHLAAGLHRSICFDDEGRFNAASMCHGIHLAVKHGGAPRVFVDDLIALLASARLPAAWITRMLSAKGAPEPRGGKWQADWIELLDVLEVLAEGEREHLATRGGAR